MWDLEAFEVFMKVAIWPKRLVLIAANLTNERAFDNRFSVLLGESPWTDALEILLIVAIDLFQDFGGPLSTCPWSLDEFGLQRPTAHN